MYREFLEIKLFVYDTLSEPIPEWFIELISLPLLQLIDITDL